MPHSGDQVPDPDGHMIGNVTSCAIDSERFLLGQACVEHAFAAEGTTIVVRIQPAETGEATEEPATVLIRFPKKKAQ